MFRLLLSHLQALLSIDPRLTMIIVHSGIPNAFIRKYTFCKSTFTLGSIFVEVLLHQVYFLMYAFYKYTCCKSTFTLGSILVKILSQHAHFLM